MRAKTGPSTRETVLALDITSPTKTSAKLAKVSDTRSFPLPPSLNRILTPIFNPRVFPAAASSQRSVFEAKDESRKQAAASDKAKEAAVEEAVARVNRQVEESMSENYR